ncbi:hypothetical protein [Rheinheimera tangshanensis]|nr:hypothetical protein [Rheinheimera tangshanensis]
MSREGRYVATVLGAFRPVDRATGAHPGIAKLVGNAISGFTLWAS